VSAQISAVIAELASQNPMPPERRRAMFADLEARIRTIHSAEMQATQAIAAIAG
jgi:ribosome maturation protein Sdo1